MIIIGVDPGFSGALASYNLDTKEVTVINMPIIKGKKNELDEQGVLDFLSSNNPDHVFIEKSQTMPGQGISSSGRYMESYGRIRGICVGMGIPYTLVHPRTWKKVIMKDMNKDKGESVVRVKQLFPHVKLPYKKDHNKADSILISFYGAKELSPYKSANSVSGDPLQAGL